MTFDLFCNLFKSGDRETLLKSIENQEISQKIGRLGASGICAQLIMYIVCDLCSLKFSEQNQLFYSENVKSAGDFKRFGKQLPKQ